MSQLEKYQKLLARLTSSANYSRRPGAIWSDSDYQIEKLVHTLKHCIEIMFTGNDADKSLAELQFNTAYHHVVKLLDENGWK